MIPTEIIFLTQLILGVCLVMIWIRLRAFEKKTDKIIQEVSDYLTYISEEEPEIKPEMPKKNGVTSAQQDKMKNELIQAVLGEYFP